METPASTSTQFAHTVRLFIDIFRPRIGIHIKLSHEIEYTTIPSRILHKYIKIEKNPSNWGVNFLIFLLDTRSMKGNNSETINSMQILFFSFHPE